MEDRMASFPHVKRPAGIDCSLPQEWWGPSYNHSAEWFEDQYGLSPEKLDNVSRLLIVNGDWDPVSGSPVANLANTGDRNHSRVLNVRMSYTETAFPTWGFTVGIRPEVDEGRKIQIETIKAWLGMAI